MSVGIWVAISTASAGTWQDALPSQAWKAPASFPIRAYSEFMPAPREGARPYELRWESPATLKKSPDWRRFSRPDKPTQFLLSWYDELRVIRPSLETLTRVWLESFKPTRPVAALFTVALSKTQNDRGQTPWTLLGGGASEKEFWSSFRTAPDFETWLCAFVKRANLSCADTRVLSKEARPMAYRPGQLPKVLFTFEAPEAWPAVLRKAYETDRLVVIPDPRTLKAFRKKNYATLPSHLPLAAIFSQLGEKVGLRVPKFGELSIAPDETWGRRVLASRPNRYAAVGWNDSELSAFRMIFDSGPRALELYGKPTARNTQIWSEAGEWILDGPSAAKKEIDWARQRLLTAAPNEVFFYREFFPPLEIQGQPVEWRRPVAAWYLPAKPALVSDWERLGAVSVGNVSLEAQLEERWGVEKKLAFLSDEESAEAALNALELSELLGSVPKARPLIPLTWDRTAGEAFEHRYWDRLVELSHGGYVDKNNADCVAATLTDRCRSNQLPQLASRYFAPYYRSLGLDAHFQAFHWITDYAWSWWGGIELNSPARPLTEIEKDGHKNVIVVIPGKRHDEAVILADHYDTAYMEDWFESKGLRHAAPGADDNHSATATLMEAARALSGLSLKRDVWLVHLTGEEYPSDCLGARALTEALVTGAPLLAGKPNPRIVGLYVLDMIGHSTDRDASPSAPSNFQIAIGRGVKAAALGRLAQDVTLDWNRRAAAWNRKENRTNTWERVSFTAAGDIPRPRTAVYPELHGEIRTSRHPRSTLYNTDGIIFSDAGIPAVLLMENYDISREGYHDSKDTLENIDLDYAAGLSRIAIESVAQAANQ